MDTFLINRTNPSKGQSDPSTIQPKPSNPYPAPKFVRADLPADVGAAYDALPDVNQHAFRIAYEQLGSSFDFRQCGM
jgi:hypothetical protein